MIISHTTQMKLLGPPLTINIIFLLSLLLFLLQQFLSAAAEYQVIYMSAIFSAHPSWATSRLCWYVYKITV